MVLQGAGGKLRQSVCSALILKGTNGLQSRLRRFDSDPSLQKFVPRRPNKIGDVARSPKKPAIPAFPWPKLSIDRVAAIGFRASVHLPAFYRREDRSVARAMEFA